MSARISERGKTGQPNGAELREPLGSEPRALALGAFLGAVLFTLLTACAPFGGESTSLDLSGDGVVLPPTGAGSQLARLEVAIPEGEHFVLRGTLPLPKGVHGGSAGPLALGIELEPGTAVPAQVEIVSRYPRAQDGADVIEVLARLPRPAGVETGSSVEFPVVVLEGQVPAAAQPADPRDGLLQGPLDLPGAVATLLSSPSNIQVVARDVFQHEYRLDLLGSASHHQLLKHGFHHAQLRSHGSLMPVSPTGGNQGTLAHFFGVHSYLGTWSGEPVVTLDLRIHNGHDGADKTTTSDDPLGRVYFRHLELRVPQGFTVLQAFDNPLTGSTQTGGGMLRWRIVDPNPDGSLHVMAPHGQFHRRLAIAPTAVADRARALLDQAGLGFARRGNNPEGFPLYSWWNLGTARWFPQRFQLPSLAHIPRATLEAQLQGHLNTLQGPFSAGTSTGGLPFSAARLGWAHPHGVSYGGMTGGDEIVLVDGISMLEVASLAGYRAYQLRHRANTDRQPRAFFRYDGRPTRLEDWIQTFTGNPFLFSFYMGLQGGGQDPMGWSQAPTFQVAAVQAQGLEPAYQAQLLSFQPHDLQHLIRYTRNAKVLAWAGNDSLAKDDLWMQAELFRLSYHPYLNGQWGYKDPTGMRFALDFVSANPAKGFPFGRGESWGLDAAIAHFAFADDDWRALARPWLRDVVQMLRDAQIPCNGHIHVAYQPKWLDGKYRAAQTAEDAIVHNTLLSIYHTVLQGDSPAHAAMARDALADSLQAMIGGIQWHPTLKGPMSLYAVGPVEISAPVFCTWAQQPADGKGTMINNFQTWSAFGYGYQVTGDPFFLQRAAEMAGSDLLSFLHGAGTANLENRAGVLAVVQRLNGLL